MMMSLESLVTRFKREYYQPSLFRNRDGKTRNKPPQGTEKMKKRPGKTTNRPVLFWRVKLNETFVVGSTTYNKFSARQAMSTSGKVVTFKDSDEVTPFVQPLVKVKS